MADNNETIQQPAGAAPIAIDAERVVTVLFPDLSLRTWRRIDSSGKCPRAFSVGGRKLWRTSDLQSWAAWGFPNRAEFEATLKPEGNHKHGGAG